MIETIQVRLNSNIRCIEMLKQNNDRDYTGKVE